MALRIGKKKADDAASSISATPTTSAAGAPTPSAPSDDWSDFGTIPHETNPPATASAGGIGDEWTNFDSLIGADAPGGTSHASATPPVSSASSFATPGSAPPSNTVFEPARKKSAPPKALLGAAAALVLLGGGAAAYFMTQPPVEDLDAPIVPTRKVKRKPDNPGANNPKPRVVVVKPAKAPLSKAPVVIKPGAKPMMPKPGATPMSTKTTKTVVIRPITPGDRGIARVGATAPNVRAPQGGPAQMVPVPGAPIPIKSASQPSAQPGMTAEPNAVRYAAQPNAIAPSSKAMQTETGAMGAKRARLKALWNDGADAKHRNNKTAAWRVWQQGLKLAEASPRMDASAAGFRESIRKLN